MFGVDAFDVDSGLGLRPRLVEEPTDLPTSLARLHEDMEHGRKRRVPWLGPHVARERQSAVGYVPESVVAGKRARVHVNRLRKSDLETLQETEDPREGMWPVTRRVLRGLAGERMGQGGAEFKARSCGRAGVTWKKEEDPPDIAVKAYRMVRESRQ
jgi:hypothetical protein